MEESRATCHREWVAEGVGILACDLSTAGHSGAHQAGYGGRIHTTPDLDHLESDERA